MIKVSRNGNVYKVTNRERRRQGKERNKRAGYCKMVKNRPEQKDETGTFSKGKRKRKTRKERLAVWREEGPQIIIGLIAEVKYRKNEHCKDKQDLPVFIDWVEVETPRGPLTLDWQCSSFWCDKLEETEDGLITAKFELETGYGIFKDFTLYESTLTELKAMKYPLKSVTPKKLASITKGIVEIGGIISEGYEVEGIQLKNLDFHYRYSDSFAVSREVVNEANKRPWTWGLESNNNSAWRVANGN